MKDDRVRHSVGSFNSFYDRPFVIGTRIAFCRHDDDKGGLVPPTKFNLVEAAFAGRQKHFHQIGLKAGHQNLALWIAEPNVVLKHFNVIAGDHQPGKQDAAEGPSLGCHAVDGGLDNRRHDFIDHGIGNQPGASTAIPRGDGAFAVVGGGFLAFDGFGDVLSYYHEFDGSGEIPNDQPWITGDFDRRVKITDIVSDDPDGRGGLMVRTKIGTEDSADTSQSLKLTVFNPNGRNSIEVWGRTEDGNEAYDPFGDPVDGVDQMLPNLWIRMKREGDVFSLFYGSDGQNWVQIGDPVQIDFPDTVFVGVYAGGAGGLDSAGDAPTTVEYADYGDVVSGPITVNFTVADNVMTLTWDGDGLVLQSNDDVNNPDSWVNVPGGDVSGVEITIGDGNSFLRLFQP